MSAKPCVIKKQSRNAMSTVLTRLYSGLYRRWVLRIAALFMGSLLVANSWAVSVGEMAPKTVFEKIRGGGVLSLADLKGKVVLVDFWASWCPPCRKSLPLFNELKAELASHDFEVYAINVDEDKNNGIRLYNELKVDYPSVLDPKGKSPEAWNVRGMPTSYLVDKVGTVRWIHAGFKEKDLPKIKAEVLKLLKE